MIERPLLHETGAPIGVVDLVIVVIGWAIGNAVFNAFERHVPWPRRIGKLVAILVVLSGIGILFGRLGFYAAIGVVTLGQIALHGWWFPKHGIHWRTAEPRDEYLALTERMKGQRKP